MISLVYGQCYDADQCTMDPNCMFYVGCSLYEDDPDDEDTMEA